MGRPLVYSFGALEVLVSSVLARKVKRGWYTIHASVECDQRAKAAECVSSLVLRQHVCKITV